jgi:hypothetical protein
MQAPDLVWVTARVDLKGTVALWDLIEEIAPRE